LDGSRVPKVRDVIRRLKREGWYQVRQSGSHRQFKHSTIPGRVTIAGHPGDEIPPGTWNSIQKQAGWKDGDE
jgi:predicted RNA binding protein YcfA (HicA-like mRNA interferase family)